MEHQVSAFGDSHDWRSIRQYTIVEKIGEGGVGQVYRATDTRLKREVALKILPESFAADPHRMARFQREAEVLASLNHPIFPMRINQDMDIREELSPFSEKRPGPFPV